MSDQSHIEWTDATWNPVTGCTKVSPGCDHCYIERTPPFRMAHRNFDQPGTGGKTGVLLHPERLDQPLRWRNPKRIFVNSLSDLFHEDVPDEYIARAFAVMAEAQQHTFQLLTKRHARMRSLLNSPDFAASVDHWCGGDGRANLTPLPNVWFGVTVENQQWADIRIPALLDTPAAVRFLSCEPLLGPVDLTSWLSGWNRAVTHSAAHPGHILGPYGEGLDQIDCDSCDFDSGRGIDWVICGGESGPNARPMHPDWARALRDQCGGFGVPFLFKQWGEWAPISGPLPYRTQWGYLRTDGTWGCPPPSQPPGTDIARVGKRAAGRTLDGRTWDEYPANCPNRRSNR